MSYVVTEQGLVHYEKFGEGPPVVLLHGWLGSWHLWRNTMKALGEHFCTYALDFWGFGETMPTASTYSVNDFVRMVGQFMIQLGIPGAPIIGHSMGGTVALMTAMDYPDLVKKVVVVGSPIEGSSLAASLRLVSYRPSAVVAWYAPILIKIVLRRKGPLDHERVPSWYRMQVNDLSRTSLESFLTSIATLRETDLRPRMSEISVPTLGIYGIYDNVVDPAQAQLLQKQLPTATIEMLNRSKHFPMLDEPDLFNTILRDFLKD